MTVAKPLLHQTATIAVSLGILPVTAQSHLNKLIVADQEGNQAQGQDPQGNVLKKNATIAMRWDI